MPVVRRPPPLVLAPFPIVEADVAATIADLGPCTVFAQDPPWSELATRVRPAHVVLADSTDIDHLERLAAAEAAVATTTVVGVGGGRAIDTAKFVAWRTGKRLVHAPTVVSVDAAFTHLAGVRVAGRVQYVGPVRPEMVVLDVDVVRRAPARLNRAGAGDVLSCHTGLYDWSLGVATDTTHPWHPELAALGRDLLRELDAAAADIAAVTADGVRFLAGAFARIGAADAAAGHSRFEEGSEHFLAYGYEHRTGVHQIHGELVGLFVVAAAVIQDHGVDHVVDLVRRLGLRAHPDDLGIDHATFVGVLRGAADHVRAAGLDVSILDVRPVDAALARRAWDAVTALPRA